MCLITEFGCSVKPLVKDLLGDSLLHHACFGGSLDLVEFLIQEHEEDVNTRNDQGNTPLCYAAGNGSAKVAMLMIEQHGCDPNVVGYLGKSLLHYACEGGSVDLVRYLIEKCKVNVDARDDQLYTPLHIAAFSGTVEVALFLIKELGCDVNTTGYLGRSLLHDVCEGGNLLLVQLLLSSYGLSVLSDDEANTPLHSCSIKGHSMCVEALLSANAPPLIRNNAGKTPVDVSKDRASMVLNQYLRNNREKQVDYNAVLALAEKKYSGKHPITRLFFLGNCGAGKTSLVESLKT